MASKLAIAIGRENAVQRLLAAVEAISAQLDVPTPDLAMHFTRSDMAAQQVNQLVAIAMWAEQVADSLSADEQPEAQPATEPETDYASMTVAELRALAEERGVDLGDATRKADIIAALEEADNQ